MTPSPLDSLPVFATDQEIAVALVGKPNAEKWRKTRLPALEKIPGFPKVDEMHGGRPIPLLKLFYDNYLKVPRGGRGVPDGEEDESVWKRQKRRA